MKKFIILILLLSVIGCGTGKDDSVEISFWNPFGGPDGETMNQLITDFNKEYEGQIRIKPQVIDNAGGAYYEKIRIANQSNKSPDLAIYHIDRLPLYVALDTLEVLSDDDLIKAGINKADYIKSAWDGVTIDDKLYAIPLDVHPMILWYNKDLISKEDIPKTLEGMKEKSKTFNSEDKYLFAMPNNPFVISRIFYGGLLQNGGAAIDPSDKAMFNKEEGIKTMSEIVNYANDPSLNPETGADVTNMFKQGKIATMIEGIWMLSTFDGLNVGAVTWEELFGSESNAMWASSHTFGIPKQKEMSPEKKEATLTFIKYINEHSLEWAKAGQIPANKKIHEMDEFKKLEVQSEMAKRDASFAMFPNTPAFSQTWSGIERLSNEAVLKRKTVEEVLDEAAKEGNTKAERQKKALNNN